MLLKRKIKNLSKRIARLVEERETSQLFEQRHDKDFCKDVLGVPVGTYCTK